MTGKRPQRTGGKQSPINLSANLGTSATNTSGPTTGYGTGGQNYNDMQYVPLPPVARPPSQGESHQWSFVEKFGVVVGLLVVFGSLVGFFFRLDSNVDGLKSDVKEVKTKIEKLDEQTVKQINSGERVSTELQRLGEEERRTQDYVQGNRPRR